MTDMERKLPREYKQTAYKPVPRTHGLQRFVFGSQNSSGIRLKSNPAHKRLRESSRPVQEPKYVKFSDLKQKVDKAPLIPSRLMSGQFKIGMALMEFLAEHPIDINQKSHLVLLGSAPGRVVAVIIQMLELYKNLTVLCYDPRQHCPLLHRLAMGNTKGLAQDMGCVPGNNKGLAQDMGYVPGNREHVSQNRKGLAQEMEHVPGDNKGLAQDMGHVPGDNKGLPGNMGHVSQKNTDVPGDNKGATSLQGDEPQTGPKVVIHQRMFLEEDIEYLNSLENLYIFDDMREHIFNDISLESLIRHHKNKTDIWTKTQKHAKGICLKIRPPYVTTELTDKNFTMEIPPGERYLQVGTSDTTETRLHCVVNLDDKQEPTGSLQKPPCSGQTPSCSGQTPSCSHKNSSCSGQTPSCSHKNSSGSGQTPSCSGQTPSCSHKNSSGSGQTPSRSLLEPSGSLPEPSCSGQQPSDTNNKLTQTITYEDCLASELLMGWYNQHKHRHPEIELDLVAHIVKKFRATHHLPENSIFSKDLLFCKDVFKFISLLETTSRACVETKETPVTT